MHIIDMFPFATVRKKGAILLFVSITTGSIALIILSYCSRNVLQQNIVSYRLLYEQRFRLTEGGLRYALAHIKKHFTEFGYRSEYTIDLSEYAQLLDNSYTMQAQINYQQKSFIIKTCLFKSSTQVFCIVCRLVQKGQQFYVENWRIGVHS